MQEELSLATVWPSLSFHVGLASVREFAFCKRLFIATYYNFFLKRQLTAVSKMLHLANYEITLLILQSIKVLIYPSRKE